MHPLGFRASMPINSATAIDTTRGNRRCLLNMDAITKFRAVSAVPFERIAFGFQHILSGQMHY